MLKEEELKLEVQNMKSKKEENIAQREMWVHETEKEIDSKEYSLNQRSNNIDKVIALF